MRRPLTPLCLQLSRGGTVIPKELIDFLKQLPIGQLEIAYENFNIPQRVCSRTHTFYIDQ